MPPPIRKLADRYLYDPAHVKVKADTLTVDSVEQFQLEVKTADKADKLVEVLAAEKPDQAIVFVRTKIRTDQLYRKLRDRGMNVKALHGDMSQGSRDGVMLGFKGGRVPILVATDVAARGLDVSTVTHVVNFDVPTLARRLRPPHRPHRPRRPLGPRDHVRRAAPEGARCAAIEEHIGIGVSPWIEGAHVAPGARSTRSRAATPSRSISRDGDEPFVTLIAATGRADGIEVADLVHTVTDAAGIDGEAVRDVRVLERFSLLAVPADEAERISAALKDRRLEVEPARN